MAQEKSNLALQLGEQKGQLNMLQKEIQSLKEESNLQLEQLSEENTALRNRLRDVAHSPLSDNEKQQLLYETHHRHHSSAPASIATNLVEEGNGGDITACPTPDWDKHSSGNVSEVSVACLQDKINQMQETHYSTNEELQATLQELTDLQRQLTELQQENERLNEEKTLMFDSLCRQTERLNDSRSEVESLKQLLYREKDETGQYESAIEREEKLVELLKSAQEEKQGLLLKLEQINNEIQEARANIVEKDGRITQLAERVRTLESTLDAKHAEHKLLDQELAQAKDQCSGKQIEINRLTDLLDNARTKIVELEQDRALSDKSELDELLDNARKEKDSLESEVAHLKEQLAISKNEIEKLKEQVSILQEECKVTRNNARTTQCDLEYKCEKLVLEKNNLNDQLLEFQEAVNELQHQSQCQLEDKRQLSAVLSETQRNLSEAERKNLNLETELQELKKLRTEEVEEWEKFQNDLLTSVRVANDFKTEAQQELQRMIMENKSYREKERQLKSELEKLKGDKKSVKEGAKTLSGPKVVEKQNSAEMENFLRLSRKSKEKRGKSKDTVDAAVPKEEKKPDVLTKMVKRREKVLSRSKRTKTLSVEEELLLKSLNDWYEVIDKSVPEANLTEEQKVVKKLKALYENDGLKEKPVAHKPKNQLAISKPLLDSVFLNPKLEEIANDPNMPTIEEMDVPVILSYECLPELRNSPGISNRRGNVQSDAVRTPEKRDRTSVFSRSKSCDDLYGLDVKQSPALYRANESEDLRNDMPLVQVARESSILPSDSASNPRYSDFAYILDGKMRQDESVEIPNPVRLPRNNSVKYDILDSVIASIPKGASEGEMTNEQKFALRLKKALDEAERKNTLIKKHKSKKVIISSPVADSVEKNAKLRDILLNPQIQLIRNNYGTDEMQPHNPLRQSKSYQDISFSFNIDSNNETKSIDSTQSTLGDQYGFNRKSSLNETFSSLEFESELADASPRSSNPLSTFGDSQDEIRNKSISSNHGDKVANQDDNPRRTSEKITHYIQDTDLLYNDTISKKNRTSNNSSIHEKDGEEKPNNNTSLSLSEDKVSVNNQPEYTVKPDEDEIDNHHCTTVITYEDYSTVLVNPQDETVSSDLTYNETLNKKLKQIEQTLDHEDNIEEERETSLTIPDIIVDLGNTSICKDKAEEYNNLLSENRTSANFDDKELFDKYYKDALNEKDNEHSEYDYHSILKENRYGVVSPLNVRLTYKDVVKEIKTRYPSEKGIENSESDDEASCVDSAFSDEVGRATSKHLDDIDVEMERIFEKYLHTPVTKVITRLESNDTDDSKIDGKFENEIVAATNYAVLEKERVFETVSVDDNPGNESLDELVPIVNDNKEQLLPGNVDDDKNISATTTDGDEYNNTVSVPIEEGLHISDISDKAQNIVDDDNVSPFEPVKDFVQAEEIEVEKQYPKIVESVNENIFFTSNTETCFSPNPDFDNNLSEEELTLVRSIRHFRFSRPLSDFNENDLDIIERLSAIYLPSSTTEVVSDSDNTSLKNTVLFADEDNNLQEAGYKDSNSNTQSSPVLSSNSEPSEQIETLNSTQCKEEIFKNSSKEEAPSKVNRHNIEHLPVIQETEFSDLATRIDKNEVNVINNELENKHFEQTSSVFPKSSVESSINEEKPNTSDTKQNDADDDDDDAVKLVLEKMSAPLLLPRKKKDKYITRNAVLEDVKPKVILRNPNYESVKNKFEYFSKLNADVYPAKRRSLNPSTGIPVDRRQVKSWAEHFERRSLDTNSSYEPVYANLKSLELQKAKSESTQKLEKKPLPVPRSRYLGSTSRKNSDISHDIKNDTSVKEIKMSDCKIISENDTENLNQELSGSDYSSIGKIKVPDLPMYHETANVIVEGSNEIESESGTEAILGIKKSEKFLDMHDGSPDSVRIVEDDLGNLASGAETSFSSIAVAGKFEQLDITRQPGDSEELPSGNESRLNLFHLESPSYDESYLNLFKAPEERVYEDISGVRKPQKGYLNIAYLGDGSDGESCEDLIRKIAGEENILRDSDSKPKIIDFVPLDDATEPVFKKDSSTDPPYDTLEREKTFQVLNMAASTGAVRKSVSITESKGGKSPVPTNSRMSFSAAKKVFENLLEANLDKDSPEKSKLRKNDSLREKMSEIEVRSSKTVMKGPL